MESKGLVVLSGGLDSTVALGLARLVFDEVHAVSFRYGQRHAVELEAASTIAGMCGVHHYRCVDITSVGELAVSAMTDPAKELKDSGGLHNLPTAFTPSRNLMFLAMASSYALSHDIFSIVTGLREVDSVYPDARRSFVDIVERAVVLGNGIVSFSIQTPLAQMTKAQTISLGLRLGMAEHMVRSISCYQGTRCGACSACVYRAKGFAEVGLVDTLPVAVEF
jgi:7-cyano-7-deazaguanine synthase